jgi:hypothetical protein
MRESSYCKVKFEKEKIGGGKSNPAYIIYVIVYV